MNPRAEYLLTKMRRWLALAADSEQRGAFELAQAQGATAANKLAQAVRMANVVPLA